MISKVDLEAALSAHAQWKKRLQDAIAKGESEFKVDTVKKDDACQFGKWLYGLTPEERDSDDCKKVLTYHAEFHRTAADVLALALKGSKEEALKMLEYGGPYSHISGRLVLALNDWITRLAK